MIKPFKVGDRVYHKNYQIFGEFRGYVKNKPGLAKVEFDDVRFNEPNLEVSVGNLEEAN